MLRENARVAALHTPAYNMVAYPWSRSISRATSGRWRRWPRPRRRARSSTERRRRTGSSARATSRPDLRLSTAKPGARIGMANVAFDDHPSAKRFSGHIETTTADTIFSWLTRSGYGRAPQNVKAAP